MQQCLLPVKAFFLFFTLLLSGIVYAQPANDEPCNAIELTITTTCNYLTYSTVGATPSAGVPAPGCANYQGGDVWFYITVPCTGSIVIDTQTGIITDGGMAIYSGDCDNLTLIACDDDSSPNGSMPKIVRSGLTPGSTIYIRFWEFGNNVSGTFGICTGEGQQSTVGATCSTAQPFCTSNVYTYNNTTNAPSLGQIGCCLTTPNPAFFFMQIQNSGPLTITINQTSGSGSGLDVDYVLWGPFTNMNNICNTLLGTAPSGCSYSTAATEIVSIPNAIAGQYYVLLITNYSNQSGSITFSQTGGSASTNCAAVCQLTATNNGPICPGGTATLSASTVAGATYTWTGPGCSTYSGQNPTVTVPTTPGTYTYTVTATPPTGFSCSAATTVTVATGILGGTAAPAATSCPGVNDGTITITPTPSGNYSYTLTPGNITQNSPTFTGLAPGTYSVTFTGPGGCSGSVNNISVVAGPALVANAIATATSCPTVFNGTITLTPLSGTGPFTYTLNPGNIQQTGNNVFTNLAPGTYTASFTTASGCQGSVSGNIIVPAGPVLTAASAQVDLRCSYTNDGTITVTPQTGAGPYSFTLNPGNITQSGATATTFTGLAAYQPYTIQFTDNAGCQGTLTTTLTSNPELKVTQNVKSEPKCNGESTGSLEVTASGGVSAYQYSIDGGTNYQPSGLFGNIPANTYNIKIKDNVGCFKDTTIILGEPTKLNASASNSKPATCDGNDGEITIIGSGGTPPYTYSINNGAFVPTNVYIAPTVGPYTNIKVKDANDCLASTSTIVTYINNLVADLGADTSICQGDTIRFFPQITGNADKFRWIPGARMISDTVKNAVAFPLDTTHYKLIIAQGPCSAEDEVTVNVKWKPIAHAGNDTVVCFNTTSTLIASVSHNSGDVIYSWSPKANLSTPDSFYTVFTPVKDTSGMFLFSLSIKDDYGCNFEVLDYKKVTVRPAVPAFAGNDTIAVKGIPHKLLGSGGTYYNWAPASVLDNPFAAQPYATLKDDTRFYMEVTDDYTCKGYDTLFVKVYEGPTYYVPNAFSPNGDGLNDIFRAVPVGISTTEYFRIFNRYGELVFSTKEWLKGWDGNYKGKKAEMGNYIWMIKGIDRDGKVVERTGSIMLLR